MIVSSAQRHNSLLVAHEHVAGFRQEEMTNNTLGGIPLADSTFSFICIYWYILFAHIIILESSTTTTIGFFPFLCYRANPGGNKTLEMACMTPLDAKILGSTIKASLIKREDDDDDDVLLARAMVTVSPFNV